MTSARTRFPARRSAAAVAACAAIVALACAAGCSSGQHAAPRPSASATVPPVVSCEAAVLHLLSESAVAVQDGYGGGLDPNVVMARYGAQSAVFQAWVRLDGQVLAAQAEHGPDGVLAPFVPQVIALCKQYGG